MQQGSVDRIVKWIFTLFVVLSIFWLFASIASQVFEEQLVALGQEKLAARLSDGAGHFAMYRDWMLQRPSILISELRIWHPRQLIPLLAAFACFGAYLIRVRYSLRCGTGLFIAALIVELAAFAWGWMTFADPKRHPFYAQTADISAIREVVGDGRLYIIPAPGRAELLSTQHFVRLRRRYN